MAAPLRSGRFPSHFFNGELPMTQQELDRQVARATGEPLCEIRQRGFSIADPDLVDYDPESSDIEDLIVDWDALDTRRNTPLVATSA
jgi:hypothetical protein